MEEKRISWMRRLGARIIDWSLFALAAETGTWFAEGWIDPVVYYALFFLVPFTFIPVEAVLLRVFKTTPGRAFFGFRSSSTLCWKGCLRAALFFLKPKEEALPVKRRGRIAAVLLVAALTFGISGGNLFFSPNTMPLALIERAEGWFGFASEEGKFTINFPVKPDHELKSMAIPQAGMSLEMNEFTAPKDETVYAVSYVTLPRSWLLAKTSFIFKATLFVLYDQVFGKDLISKEETLHRGTLPAMNFVAREGDQKVMGRIVLCGSKLFRLTVKQPPGDEAFSPDTFFDSFSPQK